MTHRNVLARRYPVLYMHDGQNPSTRPRATPGSGMWTKRWRSWPGRASKPSSSRIPNIGERRFHEYIPFASPDVDGVQGEEYVTFIADTVKPIIDGISVGARA